MKQFFKDHSYNMIKMLLNQFGTAIFGFSLAVASVKAQNATLRNVTSAVAILFYLFLLYTMTWEIGYKDKISVESGKKKRNSLTGAWISLGANIPNFIMALFVMLASLLNVEVLSNIGAFCSSAALILEGMFTGLLTNHFSGAALNSYWWVYFLLPIPSIVVCGIAYNMGIHDIKFTGIFDPIVPESDRDPKQKKR